MLEVITKTGFDVLINLIQIIIGSILSMIVYYGLNQKVKQFKNGIVIDLLIITAASFSGILLPLNTFGILPILFVLLGFGLKKYLVLPIIFSNVIFNMLVPFNDPSFIWRTGIKRVILALVIGIVAGIILKSLKKNEEIFKINKYSSITDNHYFIRLILKNIHQNINITGFYMICGVLINTIFNKFIIYNLTSLAFNAKFTASIPHAFAKLNVVHPGFLLAVCILYSLLNFSNMAAVLVIVKPKSFVIYLGYFAVWAIILGSTIFLK